MKSLAMILPVVAIGFGHVVTEMISGVNAIGIARCPVPLYGYDPGIWALGDDTLFRFDCELGGGSADTFPAGENFNNYEFYGMIRYSGNLYVVFDCNQSGYYQVGDIVIDPDIEFQVYNTDPIPPEGAWGLTSYSTPKNSWCGWVDPGVWRANGIYWGYVPFTEAEGPYGVASYIEGLSSDMLAVATEPYGESNTIITMLKGYGSGSHWEAWDVHVEDGILSATGMSTEPDEDETIWVNSPEDQAIFKILLEEDLQSLQQVSWGSIKSSF